MLHRVCIVYYVVLHNNVTYTLEIYCSNLLFLTFRVFEIKNWILITTVCTSTVCQIASAEGRVIWLSLVGAHWCFPPAMSYQSERQRLGKLSQQKQREWEWPPVVSYLSLAKGQEF